MALSDDEREAMRAATYEAAFALLDDLSFIDQAVSKSAPSRSDVRRISGVLRRLLLEDHLTQVAGPRVGSLHFPIFDNRRTFEEIGAWFVTVGFAPFYGLNNGVFSSFHTERPDGEAFVTIGPENPTIRDVKRDTLLSDRVARLGELEISRADVLKFICYHDFGVHFSGDDGASFDAIRRFRNSMTFFVDEHGRLNLTRQDLDTERPRGALMDLAHAHTFSTAFFLIRSPSVRNLVTVLEAEIASAEAATKDRPN
jgi:hypothetical protein